MIAFHFVYGTIEIPGTGIDMAKCFNVYLPSTRSPVPITKGRWHRARITRTGRHGSLQLDHHPTQRGHSAPPLTHLELTLPLFIGSLP